MKFVQEIHILFILVLLLPAACVVGEKSPVETFNDSVNMIQSDDIVVVNQTNDSIILLDRDGNFKTTLVDEATSNTINYSGINWDSIDKRLLFVNDTNVANTESVKSISLYNGRVEDVINTIFLTGTLRSIARLTNGDYLIVESATTVEKFDTNLQRVGNPFFSALVNANNDLNSLSTGGFLSCSSSTGSAIRTHSATGATVATATSAAPVPSMGSAMQCIGADERPDGTIAVSFSGTNDGVRVFSADLSTVVWTYQNSTVLSNPGKLAVRSNGNVLVPDLSLHHIVELSSDGQFIRIIQGAFVASAGHIKVIP